MVKLYITIVVVIGFLIFTCCRNTMKLTVAEKYNEAINSCTSVDCIKEVSKSYDYLTKEILIIIEK